MKFLSIVILACLAFSSVHAASEFPTNFEELGEMFDQGTLPTKEETFGWWSGRCYKAKAPSKPRSVLLASHINIAPNNGGNLPPRTSHHMKFLRNRPELPMNYYDNNLPEFKDNVMAYMKSLDHQTFTIKEQWGSLASTNGVTVFSVKKYNNYFVGQSLDISHTISVYANCYFFKKVYSY